MREQRLYRVLGSNGALPTGPFKQEILDNDNTTIVFGPISLHATITIEAFLQKKVSGQRQKVVLEILQDGTNIQLDEEYQTFDSQPLFAGIAFTVAIVGSDIHLIIVTAGVGENLDMTYDIDDIKII